MEQKHYVLPFMTKSSLNLSATSGEDRIKLIQAQHTSSKYQLISKKTQPPFNTPKEKEN